jgi:hypothetical protein
VQRILAWFFSKYRLTKAKTKEQLKSKFAFCFNCKDIIDTTISQLAVNYYDGKHPKHFLWKDHYKFILENIGENDTILDVGCGMSHSYINDLAKNGNAIDACDMDADKIEWNKKKNKFDNVNFFVMDITKELPNHTYDVVILSHVLEHIEKPVEVLKRLKDITKKLIIRLPRYDDHWMYLLKKDLGFFYFKDRDHKREYTLKEAIELVYNADWTINIAQNDIDIKIIAQKS